MVSKLDNENSSRVSVGRLLYESNYLLTTSSKGLALENIC